MAQIVNHPNFGSELGAALGTGLGSGIGQGLTALAEHKLNKLVNAQKSEKFKKGLEAYKDQITPEQAEFLAEQYAENPKIAELFAKSQFKQLEEKNYQELERKAREERAKSKSAGLPGSENFEDIEAPEIEGRLPRNEREREQFAKMNQKERLAAVERSDKKEVQLAKKNEPGLKRRAENWENAKPLGKLAKEAIQIIRSEEAASGLLGGLAPQRFSSDATNKLENIKQQMIARQAALQGGGKQSQKLLELIEKGKIASYQSPKVQEEIVQGILDEYYLAKDENKAEKQLIEESNGKEIHNLDGKIEQRAKEFKKERLTAAYKLNKQFPAKELALGRTATDTETDQKMVVALVGGKKKWVPDIQPEPEEQAAEIVQPQGV